MKLLTDLTQLGCRAIGIRELVENKGEFVDLDLANRGKDCAICDAVALLNEGWHNSHGTT